jgi:hypothetical protein
MSAPPQEPQEPDEQEQVADELDLTEDVLEQVYLPRWREDAVVTAAVMPVAVREPNGHPPEVPPAAEPPALPEPVQPPAAAEAPLARDPTGALSVDLTAEPLSAPIAPQPKDPTQQRESMRGYLALAILGLFAAVILLSLIAQIAGTDQESLIRLLEIVLPPIIALAGTAVGFYFGSERAETSKQR